MKNSGPAYLNDVPSGVLPGSFSGMNAEFSSVEELHVSERHVVLKARRYNRLWILKGVNPGNDSEANRAALRKEFEIMMMLPSEGFPRAYALEDVEGYGLCIVMEFIEGETLARWLESKHRRSERRRLALRLMDIVARMHGSGVVSRDIKPSNIIISKLSGAPVLIDFDLADTNQHTAFKQPGGTSGYISPEQAVSFSPDRRNDIYSLATVVLEMKPPLMWRPVLRRCLKNINHRVPDADLLRKQCIRLRRIPQIAGCLLGFILLVGILTRVSLPEGQPKVETVTKTVFLHADNHKIDSLNRVIDELQDSVKSERMATIQRDQAVAAASGQACRWIRNYFAKYYKGVYDPGFDAWLETGMDSISKILNQRFSAGEVAEIERDMTDVKRNCYLQTANK